MSAPWRTQAQCVAVHGAWFVPSAAYPVGSLFRCLLSRSRCERCSMLVAPMALTYHFMSLWCRLESLIEQRDAIKTAVFRDARLPPVAVATQYLSEKDKAAGFDATLIDDIESFFSDQAGDAPSVTTVSATSVSGPQLSSRRPSASDSAAGVGGAHGNGGGGGALNIRHIVLGSTGAAASAVLHPTSAVSPRGPTEEYVTQLARLHA